MEQANMITVHQKAMEKTKIEERIFNIRGRQKSWLYLQGTI